MRVCSCGNPDLEVMWNSKREDVETFVFPNELFKDTKMDCYMLLCHNCKKVYLFAQVGNFEEIQKLNKNVMLFLEAQNRKAYT